MTTTVANDLVFGTASKAPVVVNLVIGCGKDCANDTNIYQSSLKTLFYVAITLQMNKLLKRPI